MAYPKRRFVVLVPLALLALAGIFAIVGGSYMRDDLRRPLPYPYTEVVVSSLVVAAEVGVVAAFLRHEHKPTWRLTSLPAIVFLLFGLDGAATVGFHTPGYHSAHAYWLLVASLFLFAVTAVSGTWALVTRLRRDDTNHSNRG